MGRPPILTDKLITEFCNKLRICGCIDTAIEVTEGMSRRSYYAWARAVRDGGGSAMQKKLMAAVKKAHGEAKLLTEHAVRKHFDTHWTAAAWWLERRYPKEYSRRVLPMLTDHDPDAEERMISDVVWIPAAKPKLPPAPPALPEPEPAPPPAPAPQPPPEPEPTFTVILKPDPPSDL